MADKAAINGLLRALVDHTRSHFQREELLLKKSGYANLDEHMALHQEMTEKLVALQQRYEQSSDPELGDDALEFLCTWFDEHVLEVDRRYKKTDICTS